MNELFLKVCEQFNIFAVSQKLRFLTNENLSIENDSSVIFVDDEKYDYHSICLSSILLDDLISNVPTFNTFLIPLKFIDAMKFCVSGNCFRVIPTENIGLFLVIMREILISYPFQKRQDLRLKK